MNANVFILSSSCHAYCVHMLLHYYTYRVAGIRCEILICANYASCRGLADFNPIGLLCTLLFQLSDWPALAIVPCL